MQTCQFICMFVAAVITITKGENDQPWWACSPIGFSLLKWIGRPVNLGEIIIVMTVTWEWFFPPREKKNLSCLCMWELRYKLTLTGLYLRNVTNACTCTHTHKFPNLHCVQVNKPLLCHKTAVGDTIYHNFNKISKFFIIRIRTWSSISVLGYNRTLGASRQTLYIHSGLDGNVKNISW